MTTSSSIPPDSSSSFPPPSPPFRPFSHLPTELVQHIIESTVSYHYHSLSYRERQATLASLSLVSRLFRQISQTLLSTVVALDSDRSYNNWLTTSQMDSAQARIRELVLVDSSRDSRIVNGFRSLLPGVRSVALSFCKWEDARALLSCLPSLTVLRLAFVEITGTVLRLALPQVTVLHLVRTGPTEVLARVFNPLTLPSLRALACYFPTVRAAHIDPLVIPFAAQLEVLSVNHRLTRETSTEVALAFQDKTLVDVYFADCSQHLDRAYLRLLIRGVAVLTNSSRGDLQDLEKRLRNLAPQQTPSLLYLPPYSTVPLNISDIASVREKLSQTCKEKGIDIVHEEQPKNWGSDLGISQDFWRRMKAQKYQDGQ